MRNPHSILAGVSKADIIKKIRQLDPSLNPSMNWTKLDLCYFYRYVFERKSTEIFLETTKGLR
jgi:hypothetical protein